MKHFENKNTWAIALEAIEKFFNKNHEITKLTDDEVKQRCIKLAYYIENGNAESKSKIELNNLENKGVIFNSHMFIRLAKHFYLEEFIEKKDTSNKRRLVSTLHAFLGNQYYFNVNNETFDKLCMLGEQYSREYNDEFYRNKSIERMIESTIYLKTIGFDLRIEEARIESDENIEKEIFNMLDNYVLKIGGMYFLQKVLNDFINDKYLPRIDRYWISRTIDDDRNEPLNLLINLAARHMDFGMKGFSDFDKNEMINKVVRIAESWLDISDIQGESDFEYSMMTVYDFPYYLKNEMIFDKMCIPQQYSKKFILKSLDYMIKPWFDKYANRKYLYKEYRKVAEYILGQSCLGGDLNVSNVKRETGIAKYKIDIILKDISIPKSELNSKFISLNSQTNLHTRPIILIPPNRYVFIDEHFTGFGFYIAAYDMIKENFNNIDREQGPMVEKLLRDEMIARGYKCLYGKYSECGGLKGSDCDLILKGKKLNFFEVKKKSSINEFNIIDDVSMLNSLSTGMIRAQKQAFSHELYMKKNKEIKLEHESIVEKITYEQEQFPSVKISVCFPEYSFLTDTTFSTVLLQLLILGTINTVDETRQKELEILNNYGTQIRNIIKDLWDGGIVDARNASFFSLFCSLQQILIAVWNCKTEEEFLEIISEWIYRTNKTLDPYISMLYELYCKENPGKNSELRKAMKNFVENQPYCRIIGM